MVDVAAAIASSQQEWTVLVRIEGVGTYGGQHVWSLTVPTHALASGQYSDRDTLRALPKPTADRAPPLGGMSRPGSCSVELVDVGNLLTAAMRTQRTPSTSLATAPTPTNLSISVVDGSALPLADFVLWVGAEAMRVSSRSGNTLTVASGGRGWLGTDARSHVRGAAVYADNPRVWDRRMTIELMPQDADDETESIDMGTYVVDGIEMGERLGSWILSGSGQLKYTSRQIGSAIVGAFQVQSVQGEAITWAYLPNGNGPATLSALLNGGSWPWEAGSSYFRVGRGAGVVRLSWTANEPNIPTVVDRGVLGEVVELRAGDVLTPVLCSDPVAGTFRWAPGPSPSTSRSSGFEVTSNPFDLLLCVLTSSAHPDDALELTNCNDYGNWSSLPPGYGVGMPITQIDVPSFLAARARMATYSFPGLVVGEVGKSFAEWAAGILEPLGAYLAVVDGLLTCVLPRTPLEGEAVAASLDAEDLLEVSDVRIATELIAGAITFEYAGPGGSKASMTIRASEFQAISSGRSQYSSDERATVLEVPGVVSDQAGLVPFLRALAQRRLFRTWRPLWGLNVAVHAERWSLRRGDLISVTHPDLPDTDRGVRGWSSVVCLVTDAPPVQLEQGRGLVRRLSLLAFVGVRMGRVAPAARISAVTSLGGGAYTLAVDANRYTAADAGEANLPANDALAFTAGQALRLCSAAGVPTGATVTVTAVATSSVSVTSSSAPTVGQRLRFANYVDATVAQRTRYVATANDRGEIITGVRAWEYGEV